jgi:predicted Zn-ribbon and HTH transcriptional regulator
MGNENHTDGYTVVTVECRECGYITDLNTLADARLSPERCPECGDILYISGTDDEFVMEV